MICAEFSTILFASGSKMRNHNGGKLQYRCVSNEDICIWQQVRFYSANELQLNCYKNARNLCITCSIQITLPYCNHL